MIFPLDNRHFITEFSNWINEMDSNISKDRYFDPDNDDYILTFNYTKTIEK